MQMGSMGKRPNNYENLEKKRKQKPINFDNLMNLKRLK